MMMLRPEKDEYREYFQRYIDLVPEGDFKEIFLKNSKELTTLFSSLPEHLHDYRYAEGKWSIKEMLMHIIDTERVFSYRMLVAARNDQETQIQSMNENAYAANADVSHRNMASLIEEFNIVRISMGMLFFNLSEDQTRQLANAVTYKVSPRALAYISIGHAMHHMKVLKERYLSQQQ